MMIFEELHSLREQIICDLLSDTLSDRSSKSYALLALQALVRAVSLPIPATLRDVGHVAGLLFRARELSAYDRRSRMRDSSHVDT